MSPLRQSILPLVLGAAALVAAVACGGDPDTLPQFSSSSGGGTGTASSSSSSSGDVNTGKCDVGGDTPCEQCQGTKCKAPAETCFCAPHANEADNCDAFFDAQLDCLEPDAGDPNACETAVEARFPQGVADSNAFDDCMAQNCADVCAQ